MASVTFKRGTRAEIEATAKQDGQILMETDQNKKNKMYIDLPDGSRVLIGNSGEAIDTSYDNTTSGLDATNVQNAIDKLNSNLSSFNNIFKQYYNYYTITEVDQIIILQTIEGYRPISISISGVDRVMPNISYCLRFDIGINNIEVQSDTSYIGNKIIISAIYAKSSIFD